MNKRHPLVVVRCLVAACVAMAASSSFAQQREIIIPAAELAKPEQRADSPTPGKWWLNRSAEAWGARDGAILMAGQPSEQVHKPDGLWQVIPMFRIVPYRVPELVVEPKVKGWYRIYAGLYHDNIDVWSTPHLFGKISGEKFPEFLQAPSGTTTRVAEAYWKAADLTGKSIHILQPPAPMAHAGAGWMGGISHLRLVPMSDQEVAAAKHEIELPPIQQRLFAMLDTTDEIFWNGTAETEEDIHAIIWRHQQAGFGRIYWRCFGTCLDNSLDVHAAAPRWSDHDEAEFKKRNHCVAGWNEYFGLARRFDPLKVAVDYGHTIDADVHAMVRFTNFNRPPYANFWHDHPEYYAQKLKTKKDPTTGKETPVEPYRRVPYQRVLSFAYPEVRTFYVSFFKQIASTGTKGIMIDMLRHPPIAGYEPIVSEAFKKKFGKDMEPLDLYTDPHIQEHFSEYLRAFLVELRQAIGPDIEITVRCLGPDGYGLRGKEWIEAGLINTIVDSYWLTKNLSRPTINATIAAAGTKGKALAGALHFDDVDPATWKRRPGFLSPEAILALSKTYSGRGVASFGLYESTLHVWNPDARRAIREAGWYYEPRKIRK